MTYVIAGLGNPGRKYARTRHNVGFLFLDYLVSEFSGSWQEKDNIHVAHVSISDYSFVLAKPQTFMNNSGVPLAALMRKVSVSADRLIVCHDEIDIPYGDIRDKFGGGEAGHNGLRSISSTLGTKDYFRIRIGVGRPHDGSDIVDWVLSPFSKEEERGLVDIFKVALSRLKNKINSSGDLH